MSGSVCRGVWEPSVHGWWLEASARMDRVGGRGVNMVEMNFRGRNNRVSYGEEGKRRWEKSMMNPSILS